MEKLSFIEKLSFSIKVVADWLRQEFSLKYGQYRSLSKERK